MIGVVVMGAVVHFFTGGELLPKPRPCLECRHSVRIVKWTRGHRHPVCLGCAGKAVTTP